MKRNGKESKLHALQELEKNPKQFWRGVISLTPDNSDKTNITSIEWITHYNQLLNVCSNDNNNYNNNNFLDYVKHSLPIIENVNNKGPLYFITSETDVYSSIKSLMNGKSVGLDSILMKC